MGVFSCRHIRLILQAKFIQLNQLLLFDKNPAYCCKWSNQGVPLQRDLMRYLLAPKKDNRKTWQVQNFTF